MFDEINKIDSLSLSTNFSFFYKGSFKTDLSLEILDICEFNCNSNKKKLANRKSIVLIEAIQNVEKYSLPDSISDSIFVYSSVNYTTIITCNLIDKSTAENLVNTIDRINQLSEEDLVSELKQLLNFKIGVKKSAGIGFIQMIRKLKEPLNYTIKFLKDDVYVFELFFNISLSESTTNEEMSDSLKIYNQFKISFSERTGIYYKGRISNLVTIPILKILENYLTSAYSNFKLDSKKYHVIIEMIQNVGRHNFIDSDNKGVFSISKTFKDEIDVFTCNRIEQSKILNLDLHLQNLLSMNREKIALFNEDKIKSNFTNDGSGAKIGISNIILYSSPNKVKYKFISSLEKHFFYLESQF